jgi:hypothetical protein
VIYICQKAGRQKGRLRLAEGYAMVAALGCCECRAVPPAGPAAMSKEVGIE